LQNLLNIQNILNQSVGMISGFTQFHNLSSSVGWKMENKQCSVEYILKKNVIYSGNSIIHHWIPMLLTGICRTAVGAAIQRVDGGGGCLGEQTEVWV
jgi:hypothetical protein